MFLPKNVIPVLTLLCASVWSAGAHAAERVDVAMISGKCERLIASGHDVSSVCEGKILNSGHANGRVGFYFFISDKATLTISGEDLANPTPDTDETRVDLILLNLGIEGIPPSETKAFGRCLYENPFRSVPARVNCKGATDDGSPFEAHFVTDGTAPTMLTDLELVDLPPVAIEASKPGLSRDPKLSAQQ